MRNERTREFLCEKVSVTINKWNKVLRNDIWKLRTLLIYETVNL